MTLKEKYEEAKEIFNAAKYNLTVIKYQYDKELRAAKELKALQPPKLTKQQQEERQLRIDLAGRKLQLIASQYNKQWYEALEVISNPNKKLSDLSNWTEDEWLQAEVDLENSLLISSPQSS